MADSAAGAAPQALAKARRPAWEAQYAALAGQVATTAAEAREIREEYRLLLAETTTRKQADDVRIGLVRAGARTFNLSGESSDREIVRKDAQAYLSLGDGAHGDEVRDILATLDVRKP
jgi:hypothetical protein